MKMNKVRKLNLATGIILIIYAIVISIFGVLVTKNNVQELSGVDPELLLSGLSPDKLGIVIAFSICVILAVILAIALVILSVITIVKNGKVVEKSTAKTLGLTAGIMAAAGFFLGWIPIVNVLYLLATAILYITSAVSYAKLEKQSIA
jgi:hypothetical protein